MELRQRRLIELTWLCPLCGGELKVLPTLRFRKMRWGRKALRGMVQDHQDLHFAQMYQEFTDDCSC